MGRATIAAELRATAENLEDVASELDDAGYRGSGAAEDLESYALRLRGLAVELRRQELEGVPAR